MMTALVAALDLSILFSAVHPAVGYFSISANRHVSQLRAKLYDSQVNGFKSQSKAFLCNSYQISRKVLGVVGQQSKTLRIYIRSDR